MTHFYRFLVLFACFSGIQGCADKYQAYSKKYTFRNDTGVPDYSNLDHWAAHPLKKDPSDSIPAPLRNGDKAAIADVFFVHPTTFTNKGDFARGNAAIDDPYLNAKTDYSTILFQASAFNQYGQIFAPRYRQAHIRNFYAADSASSNRALALAYQDVRTAFIYYLEHFNNGRPILLAAHSQGALHAIWLLKEFFDGKPLQNQLVAAYAVGWPLHVKALTTIPVCSTPEQIGCVCSWRTFKTGYLTPGVTKENARGDSILVTNPISWTTDNTVVGRSRNKGAVLNKFNKIFPTPADAQISHGVLFTEKPRFPWSFLYKTSNYHIGDINLYYINVRENIATRIHRFQQGK
ncbi:MAG: DUF3089 domain-containing protein [Bacteroidetes bacterium]|nr:DUF3089 domain-containing protein [Bacteroidota bacterium]